MNEMHASSSFGRQSILLQLFGYISRFEGDGFQGFYESGCVREGDLPDDRAPVGTGSYQTLTPMHRRGRSGGGFVVEQPSHLRDWLPMARRLGLGLAY